jgi:hypothetical protein
MPASIDFQPLAKMEEIKFAGQNLDWSKPKLEILKALPLIDKLAIFIFILISAAAVFKLGPAGLVLLIAIPSYIFSKRIKDQEGLVWQSFIVANGWQAVPSAAANAFVPPSLAGAGHNPKCGDGASGTINSLPFKLFNYQYSIGSGKNEQTFTSTVVLLEMLKVDLPHILLRPTKGLASDPPPNLTQQLRLEGDFNKYFRVFGQKGDEINQLTILTPDLMQFLISSDIDYDIELYPLGVAVFSKADSRRIDKLPALIDFSLKLYDQLIENLPKYKAVNPTGAAAAAAPLNG